MKFSAFAPFGMWAFSSKPTHAESFYRAMVASMGNVPGSSEAKGTISTAPGTRMEAKIYADSMTLARGRYVLEHAGAQVLPEQLTEMLPVRESELKIVPGFRETTDERRDTVAARLLLARGAAKVEVENALETLLADDFLLYRPTPIAEAVQWPAALGDQPQSLQLPTVARKLIRLTAPISVGLGAPQFVAWEFVDPDNQTPLLIGDELVVDTGNLTVAEKVTILDLDLNFIYATFNNPHPIGAICTTAPFPIWTSTKRLNLIVLTGPAAADADTRRRVDEQLRRQLRGPSTWAIAGESSPGSSTVGPFTVAGGMIGVTTIGLIAF